MIPLPFSLPRLMPTALPRWHALALALTLALTLALAAGGCAATGQQAQAPQQSTAQADAAQAQVMAQGGRSAQAPSDLARPVTSSSIAPDFPGCIDARRGLGEVKLGMSVQKVRRAAPWLDVDPLNSELLSVDIHTLCGERVWDYKVRFDADCRVRSIWFTGPQRLERIFTRICTDREDPHGEETAFKWHCDAPDGRLSVTEHGRHMNLYRLLRLSVPDGSGRCLLPRYWD